MLARNRKFTASTNVETADLEKVLVIELNPDDFLATKMYIYYLISVTVNEQPLTPYKEGCPRVVIFDGRCLFNQREFTHRFVQDQELLKQIRITRVVDDGIMLMCLHDYLRVHLSCNLNLALIVIMCNSNILFPDLLEKINHLLFSLSITVRVVLVVDQLNKIQKDFYRQKNICEMIKCKIEKKNTKNTNQDNNATSDHNKVKVQILSSKSSSIATKEIQMISS